MADTQGFYTEHYGKLIDKKVVKIAIDPSGSEGPTFGLIFDDGTIAWIQRDEEGNGAGFLDIEKPRKGKAKQ